MLTTYPVPNPNPWPCPLTLILTVNVTITPNSTVTHWPSIPCALWSWPIYMQKQCQMSLGSKDGVKTGGRMESTPLPSPTNAVVRMQDWTTTDNVCAMLLNKCLQRWNSELRFYISLDENVSFLRCSIFFPTNLFARCWRSLNLNRSSAFSGLKIFCSIQYHWVVMRLLKQTQKDCTTLK